MDTHILDNIPLNIDLAHMARALRIADRPGELDDLKVMIAEAESVGRPKAMYQVEYIQAKGQDFIDLGSAVFTSRVLRVNVEKAHRVFPFIATCGMELHEWAGSINDLLRHFWADAIAEMALRSAMQFLEHHLAEQYEFSQLARMNPGSLQDWPLREQRALFALLGDPQAAIGVRLTGSLLMVPTKTVSGLIFPTEESFASCQLCPREDCRGRRAPYDKDLYDRKYRATAQQV